MNRSVKLKNNNYLDSSSVSVGRTTLYDYIFNPLNGLAKKNRLYGCDFNDLYDYGTGLFIISSPTANSPGGVNSPNYHWYVIQFVLSEQNGFALQIAWFLFGTDIQTYMRFCTNVNWNDWIAK